LPIIVASGGLADIFTNMKRYSRAQLYLYIGKDFPITNYGKDVMNNFACYCAIKKPHKNAQYLDACNINVENLIRKIGNIDQYITSWQSHDDLRETV
jgi:hypothetical protein